MGCEKLGTTNGLVRLIVFSIKSILQIILIIEVVYYSIDFSGKVTYQECEIESLSKIYTSDAIVIHHFCPYDPDNPEEEPPNTDFFVNDLSSSTSIVFSAILLTMSTIIIVYEFVKSNSNNEFGVAARKMPLHRKLIRIYAYYFIQVIICASTTYIMTGYYLGDCFYSQASGLYNDYYCFIIYITVLVYFIPWGGYLVYTDLMDFQGGMLMEFLFITFPIIYAMYLLAKWLIDRTERKIGVYEFLYVLAAFFSVSAGFISNLYIFFVGFYSVWIFWMPLANFLAQISLSTLYIVFQDKDDPKIN